MTPRPGHFGMRGHHHHHRHHGPPPHAWGMFGVFPFGDRGDCHFGDHSFGGYDRHHFGGPFGPQWFPPHMNFFMRGGPFRGHHNDEEEMRSIVKDFFKHSPGHQMGNCPGWSYGPCHAQQGRDGTQQEAQPEQQESQCGWHFNPTNCKKRCSEKGRSQDEATSSTSSSSSEEESSDRKKCHGKRHKRQGKDLKRFGKKHGSCRKCCCVQSNQEKEVSGTQRAAMDINEAREDSPQETRENDVEQVIDNLRNSNIH